MHRKNWIPVLATVLLAAACAGAPPAHDAEARAALAPTGALRVGVYPGSPTSYIPAAGGGEPRGVGYEMGRELAKRLGVPFAPTVFPNNAQLLDAVKSGQVDVVFTNATDERRRFIDFSGTALALDKSYLVPAGSRIADAAAVDREGVRVGVSQGSSSQGELTHVLKHARIVPVASLKEAGAMLADGRLEAFGTNNSILHEMGDGLPGSRVLPGRWGTEALAFGVPKGRSAGLAYLEAFARSVQADGSVARAAARAGLRGLSQDR
jgi:polar amino acid transport system substrate-binding protein